MKCGVDAMELVAAKVQKLLAEHDTDHVGRTTPQVKESF